MLLLATISFSQTTILAVVSSTSRGDINEDGKVDIFDLLEMLKMLSNPQEKTERSKQIADVDANGKNDIFDLLGMLKVLSGTQQPGVIYWGPITPGDTTVVQGITFVSIPGGTFQMGTNDTDYSWLVYSRPVHTVTLDSFQICQYEIT